VTEGVVGELRAIADAVGKLVAFSTQRSQFWHIGLLAATKVISAKQVSQ